MSFIEIGHLGWLDTSIIMWDNGGEYESEDNIWVMAQHDELESS